MSHYKFKGFSTNAIHNGFDSSEWPGSPVNPGIIMSTTFKQKTPGQNIKYEYGRSGNPTREVLEKSLAGLEKAKYSLTFSSGLSAESCIIHLLSSGDEIICMDDVYGGTNRLFSKVFSKFGISTKMVDCCDIFQLKGAITNNTKIVWLETPTNPNLKVVNIQEVASLLKTVNPKVLLVVDNTFLTPYFQNPLTLGADIVIHSLTKYINGHCDVVMGALMLNDDEIYNNLKFHQNAVGFVPSPFDCYLVIRGIKTLALRMDRHQSNAMKIAEHFVSHPKLIEVRYPGLPSHHQHELCKTQASGFGGMLVFMLKGGVEKTREFLSHLKIFSVAESLGGYESLIEIPSIMTHASVPQDQRIKLNISDNFIRLSIGLEDPEDLIDDLEQALSRI